MILDDIVETKQKSLQKQKEYLSLDNVIKASEKRVCRDFYGALSGEHMAIIGEVKKASPSKGIIKADFDPVRIASDYTTGGADAISVLTEQDFFLGSDQYLTAVKDTTALPVLRKDFIIDAYQIL